MNKIEILKKSLIFSGLNEEELAELAGFTVEKVFSAGAAIFHEEDAPDWFYIVADGRIKITRSSSQGKELIIAFFGTGEVFGEVAVFAGKPYPASAHAVGPAKVIGIKRNDLLSFLAREPQVALRIINVLGERLRDAQNRIRDLVGERVEQRLARMLLMLMAKLGPELPFTRQDIADLSGTTVETTIRFMSRLKEGGIIRSARGTIIILDETKLRLLSEGTPEISRLSGEK